VAGTAGANSVGEFDEQRNAGYTNF